MGNFVFAYHNQVVKKRFVLYVKPLKGLQGFWAMIFHE